MIIKKITLNNIRSYKNQEIVFKGGSTLLSGDIGSGKTSILLAIEFALFGLQPGQRGTFLLRNGEEQGGVSMEFEVDGKNVLVERTLKRNKTVSQDYSAITINNEKQELAVTELKNRILDLLNYPKEFSKKQNILYKFTVYTPQEEMKQIIIQDSTTRMNTLRHVFGVDKYKRVLENILIITQKLREEKRVKETLISTFEEDKVTISNKEEELLIMQSDLDIVKQELIEKSKIKEKVEQEKQEIFKKIEEKNKLKSEFEKTKLMIVNKKNSLTDNEKLIRSIRFQIKEFENLKFDPLNLQNLEENLLNLKKEKEELNKKQIEIMGKVSTLNAKNLENEKLQTNMSNLEICPTCLQDVDAVYRSNVLNKLHNETAQNKNKLEELENLKKGISQKIEKANLDISFKEKELTDLKLLRVKLESVDEKIKRIEELIVFNENLSKDILLLEKQSQDLNVLVFKLSKFDKISDLKQQELNESLKQEKIVEIKLAELRKEIEFFSKQIQELKEKVKSAEEIKLKLNYISELENWLSKKFIPLVSFIEKNVMVRLKSEFSQLFQEWFLMLVSETFNVSLREDFTPVVEQQDYEIDYAYLSGGERTAIALAYRLALNQVINSLMSKIKTKDLVILDEPTDGFSEQQLDKMRSVLEQLKIKQLIIVSHEQKIESFVEDVIRFRKENGISRIE